MRCCSLSFVSALLLLAVTACGPSPGGGGGDDDDDSTGPDAGRPDARPWEPSPDGGVAARCEKIDLLFVIDNSGSMDAEQVNLAANFPAFIQVIAESGLDYRIAVTSTAVDYEYSLTIPGIGTLPQSISGGDNGAMLQRCGMSRRWIESADADPATTFGCLAALGTTGSSDEMPLAAMRRAFGARMADGTNNGFRRDDALLGIVILTDENDCSYEQPVNLAFTESLCSSQMEAVSGYVGFLDTYTGDRGRWASAVIAGPGPSSCSSTFGSADYAQRLDEFVTMTGANAVFSSICEGDLTVGLADALEVFSAACDDFPPID